MSNVFKTLDPQCNKSLLHRKISLNNEFLFFNYIKTLEASTLDNLILKILCRMNPLKFYQRIFAAPFTGRQLTKQVFLRNNLLAVEIAKSMQKEAQPGFEIYQLVLAGCN